MIRVVVTGIGFASSIGVGQEEVLSSLQDLRHGFALQQLPGEGVGPELVYGKVDGFDFTGNESRNWTFPGSEDLDTAFVSGLSPHGAYAWVALEEALKHADLKRAQLGDGKTGLFCASAGSARMMHHHIGRMAAANWKRSSPMGVVSSIAGTLNFNLAAHFGIQGANCGFVSACTSSSHAIGYAFDEIALGRHKRILVVAAEDGEAETLLPFLGMRALSRNQDPDTASRPFDQKRDGFVGTGGGVALILESMDSAHSRCTEPIAEMLGWGQASDGHNVAAPHPEGLGIQTAMKNCLASANVDAKSIDWINAHATSTPAGDRAEVLALKSLGFAEAGAQTLISSTKGLTGHGLSFTGALEAAICVLCLSKGIVPGNSALTEPDPVCDGLSLPIETAPKDLQLVLNNNSGFGGSNVSQLFAQPK